jgi:hypothetical protein
MHESMEQDAIVVLDDNRSTHPLANYEASWGTLQFHDILSNDCSDVSYSLFFSSKI